MQQHVEIVADVAAGSGHELESNEEQEGMVAPSADACDGVDVHEKMNFSNVEAAAYGLSSASETSSDEVLAAHSFIFEFKDTICRKAFSLARGSLSVD